MSIMDSLIKQIKDDIFNALMASEIGDEDKAQALTDQMFRIVQKHWGGRAVYIAGPDKSERDRQVKAAFNGRNHAEVCERFDISLRTLYRVIGD